MLALQELFGKGKRLRYLCQDESRVGLKTEPRRVVTTRGVQPVVRVAWKRQSFWLYGVVEPLSGWHFCLEYPKLCAEHFQEFLDVVSSQLGEDIALLQIDQAAAHLAYELKWPENIIPVCQPAYCPQLNPIERFWLFLKSQIKGQVFNTLGELRDRLNDLGSISLLVPLWERFCTVFWRYAFRRLRRAQSHEHVRSKVGFLLLS